MNQKELFYIVKYTLVNCKYIYYSFLDNSHGMQPDEELEALQENIGVLFASLEVI